MKIRIDAVKDEHPIIIRADSRSSKNNSVGLNHWYLDRLVNVLVRGLMSSGYNYTDIKVKVKP